MSEEQKQILEMLAGGKINVGEAQLLLAALERGAAPEPDDLKAAASGPAAHEEHRPGWSPFGPLLEGLGIPRPPRPPGQRPRPLA